MRSEPIGPPHATAEVIELQRSGAWQQIFESIRNQAVSAVGSAGVLPGSRHKNLKVSPLLSAVETKRVGFPVYVLAYRYDGELFRVLVDGRDKQRVFGDAPFSTAKLTLVILVIVVILAGVIAAIW